MMELLSQMWSLLGLLTVLQNILPTQLLSLLHSLWQSLQESLTPYSYFDVPEFLGSSAVDPNPLYRHVHLYLHHHLLLHPPSPSLPRLTLSPNTHSLSPNHSISDPSFPALWTHHSDTLTDSLEERRSFSLRLPKRHAPSLLQPYLSHLSLTADRLHRASRDRRLFTNCSSSSSWASVPFRHPSTFQTLALDPSLRSRLLSDLSSFASAGDFYRRTGRAWKRGYLLHGPPGSGKSSLIAAMANHLSYDVYDLELTRVTDNSDLRSLLIQTTNRSIIVIEDIDCSLDLTGDRTVAGGRKKRMSSSTATEDGLRNPNPRVTLSGLLNFTDGLWSCCGEERVIVFTTNHVGGVDPALLRAGRMDVHVRLGACGVSAMREMVERYVGVAGEGSEVMMGEVERLVAAGAAVTPAEAGEVLLRNREDPEVALRELVAELQGKVVEEEDGSGKEREGSPEGGWEMTPAAAAKGRNGWEGRVRFLGRLKSFTKSDSGRRGV